MPDLSGFALAGLAVALALVLLLWPGGLIRRWRAGRARARLERRQDALKQALLLELEGQRTTIGGLARRLEMTEGRLTPIVTELEATRHLTVDDEGLHLAPLGREEAARISRAHRLWERHLADDTGFSETEWHELADRQEHRLSPEETEALALRLGQPASDPHGDPIPTAAGAVVRHPGQPLAGLAAGRTARITHVEDEPAEIYERIVAAGLVPGSVVQLLEISPDGVLLLSSGEAQRLPAGAAESIAVLPLPPGTPVDPAPGRPLHELRLGEQAHVAGISPRCHGAERRRLLDLGVLPGTTIEAVMRSPSGDPTAYRIRGALIALRRDQADVIRVTPPEMEER